MKNNKAALYLRSSKDRSDVSIDAQRRELLTLAKARDMQIAHEYTDVVLSAKTADRPAFQRLLLDLRRQDRGWSTLLTVDTSRLSRRRYWAQAFKHEAQKHGVAIFYSKVPDVDPITQVLLESVLEAMDEVHSLMSREKGLAGMAENVRRGFRAGGRSPRGYRLVSIETDAIRDGKPVTKSRLE
ncbi:MAG TPA: recombinase family protein, partial [Gammaproteobacteria bacterium]|nr:recombinase family protein [Gammaproteobacteria bacterium]